MQKFIPVGLFVGLVCLACQSEVSKAKVKSEVTSAETMQNHSVQQLSDAQKAIVEEYIDECADQYSYTYQHHQYQACLDKAIEKDSGIAYTWQQKAMPYFKARKYEVGMRYLDKAVAIDPKSYLSYRGFIQCIFAKNYQAAILDFERAKQMDGNSVVMDHTYDFHIALSYLQLNQFEKAEQLFQQDIADQVNTWGEDGYHQLDLFYYALSLFEQQKWDEAITQFDLSLKKYPKFADAMYYKSICLFNLDQKEAAKTLLLKAYNLGSAGNTVNEDNAIYELYPYQLRW